MLEAYLKVLLIIKTARLKYRPRIGASGPGASDLRHPLLVQLGELIEENYRRIACAGRLRPAVARQPEDTRHGSSRESTGDRQTHRPRTRNRILIHAKWQLLHTLKPVKEV